MAAVPVLPASRRDPSVSAGPGGGAGPSRHGLALVVIATAQLMVMLDLTIVNIALPSMQHALNFSSANLTWVIDAYVLVFGGLLLLGGRSGDLFGRRRMFLAGIAVFAGASLVGGLATDQVWLVAARAAQGIGAAIASPTALALIADTFSEGAERNRAMAVYAGMSGAGAALGLLLGGIIVDLASWRWVLFVNVPIGAVVLLLGLFVLPSPPRRRGRLDVPGAIAVSLGMALVVFGLVRAPTVGWAAPATIGSFVAAVALLVSFVLVELRSSAPLVPLGFLAHRNRAGGAGIMLLLGAAMLSLIFFLTQFMQDVLHYSPIITGVAYLPIPLMVGSTGLLVSRLVRRVGVRPFLLAGPLGVGAGLGWLALELSPDASYLSLLGPLVLVGLGMGLSFVPLTLNAVSSVDRQQSGLASALLNTSQQLGGSLGLAALVTVAATVTRNQRPSGAARGSLAAHQAALLALTHGDRAAFVLGAAGAGLAFVVAVWVLRPAKRPAGASGAESPVVHLG